MHFDDMRWFTCSTISAQTSSDMPYGHLIAATVMTLGVCQGRSSIASFSILTSVSRGPSAIAEFLVNTEND